MSTRATRTRGMPLAAAVLVVVAVAHCTAGASDRSTVYRDASAAIPDRVADLLGRMTNEEKVAQLLELWGGPGVFEKVLRVWNQSSVGAVMIGGGAPNTTCVQVRSPV